MKVGIHTLNDLTAGDIIVIEKYYTGPQLSEYWYRRPWKVEILYDGAVTVIGLNKNKTDKTIGTSKIITERMLNYVKIYKITTQDDLNEFIINTKHHN